MLRIFCFSHAFLFSSSASVAARKRRENLIHKHICRLGQTDVVVVSPALVLFIFFLVIIVCVVLIVALCLVAVSSSHLYSLASILVCACGSLSLWFFLSISLLYSLLLPYVCL